MGRGRSTEATTASRTRRPRFLHEQASAKHPSGAVIEVDEGMVGVLESLWNQGVDTAYSCQGKWSRGGNPGYIFITNALGAAKVFAAIDVSPELHDDVHRSGMINLEGKGDGCWILRWNSPTVLDRLGPALADLPEVDGGAASVFRKWTETEAAAGGPSRVWKELEQAALGRQDLIGVQARGQKRRRGRADARSRIRMARSCSVLDCGSTNLHSVWERGLATFGRHAALSDGYYWTCALMVVAIGVGVSLASGIWGICGIVAGSFAMFAYYARTRYEKSENE